VPIPCVFLRMTKILLWFMLRIDPR